MGLVSDGCQDSGSSRMSYWRPFLKVGSCIMGFPTECLSPAVPRFIPIIGRHMLRFYRHSRHQPVGKESGLTSYIERLNNTLRQRISRLVRKTLSFSKKLENHGWCYLEFYSWLQSPNTISNAEDSTPSIFSILYIKALPNAPEVINNQSKSLRYHGIVWKNTTEPNGFGISNEDELVNVPYQF